MLSRAVSRRTYSMLLRAKCGSITLPDKQITGGIIFKLACFFEPLLGQTLCSWQCGKFLRCEFSLVQLSSMKFIQELLCFGRSHCEDEVSKNVQLENRELRPEQGNSISAIEVTYSVLTWLRIVRIKCPTSVECACQTK
jgi:hypothetical protein